MRTWILAIVSFSILVVAGCSSTDDRTIHRDQQINASATGRSTDLAAVLLFDRKPGPYNASDFAMRSDWPSTDAFYSPGQVIYFSERFVDFQGRGFDESDYTYRRFDTYRAGIGFR